jgi:hypothetical protein
VTDLLKARPRPNRHMLARACRNLHPFQLEAIPCLTRVGKASLITRNWQLKCGLERRAWACRRRRGYHLPLSHSHNPCGSLVMCGHFVVIAVEKKAIFTLSSAGDSPTHNKPLPHRLLQPHSLLQMPGERDRPDPSLFIPDDQKRKRNATNRAQGLDSYVITVEATAKPRQGQG